MSLAFPPIRNATSAKLDADQERLHQAERALLAALPPFGTSIVGGRLIDTVTAKTHDRQVVAWAFWSLVNGGYLDLDSRLEVRRTTKKLPSHLRPA